MKTEAKTNSKTNICIFSLGLANLIRDIKRKSGVEISFDTNTLPAPYKKAIIIRGGRSQIEAAVRIINRRTGEEVSQTSILIFSD